MVVAGETGSGKTTQLPKICLELGRGVRGMIGHTQPRRIAARSVAERIAEELGTELGDAVGYAVRFTDQVSRGTYVKLMTDGILLAEIQRDRMLWKYDTIIVDEAHERSLNIDFLLGYLSQLLPRRPDLKVVITSATIDPQRFATHFGDAPVVEVSGRTYPVEVRYRPWGPEAAKDADADVLDDLDEATDARDRDGRRQHADAPPPRDDRDQMQAIGDAVVELCAEGPGDILVFLSGEREIRDTADHLGKLDLRHTEVLPLYARLSTAEQHKVFTPHTGRRVVLATNVAETSLTVPGIRYVIDPGTARISRYSQRTKVQRLPIEPVSQASADQRKGRCGRVEAGICIRLYTEADYAGPPAVHRAGGAAHGARVGDPADDLARPRRGRGLPVPRPAGRPRHPRRRRRARRAGRDRPGGDGPSQAAHPGRPAAGPAAHRPAAGPDGGRGRHARAACRRCSSSPRR